MSLEPEVDWHEVLAHLERQLAAYRACLTGADVPEPYRLPTNLGPLPSELAPRARTLLELNRGIEAAIAVRRGRLAAAMVERSDLAWPEADPAFLDTRV